jgi:hypothetical protein
MVAGVLLGHILGPLIAWLILRDKHPYIEEQGREALVFQIKASIIVVVLVALGFPLTFICVGVFFFIAAGIVALADIVLTIIAVVKTLEGAPWRYPTFSDPKISF